jgi:uncharacterized protein (DUF2141 family)
MTLQRPILAACFLSLLSCKCAAAELTVTVDGLRDNNGQVLICVFLAGASNTAAFPDCSKGRAVRTSKAPINGGKAIATYKGLEDGSYAIAIIHDENENGALDTNFLGIPSEGVGVSTNPKVMGKPHFDQGQFDLKGQMSITINAKYIL